MYILSNALKNLVRNKGRNILVGLVMTAIIAAAVVGLVVHNTASAVINDYRTRFGSRVIFNMYFETATGTVLGTASIHPDQVFDFAQSQYLMRYTATAIKLGGNENLMAVAESSTMPTASQRLGPSGEIDPNEKLLTRFRVMGNVWDEFDTGERFLLEGRMPTDGEAIISQELAELNDLDVGDEITVTTTAMITMAEPWYLFPLTTAFTISGIYYDLTEVVGGTFVNPSMNRRNEILTTVDTLIETMNQHPSARAFIFLQATYYLRDPAYLPYFETEIREKGLPDRVIVSTDEEAFNTIVKPVEGLRSVLFTFVIVVLGLGAVILILLSSIAIRERNYEIGVLRAMGMKKGKVVRGLLYEIGVITIVCLAIGLTVGVVASQPVADNLLQQQVEIAEMTQAYEARSSAAGTWTAAQQAFERHRTNAPVHEPLSEINVNLGVVAIVQIVAVSILLALAASAIGIVNITRYEPIKILMERN